MFYNIYVTNPTCWDENLYIATVEFKTSEEAKAFSDAHSCMLEACHCVDAKSIAKKLDKLAKYEGKHEYEKYYDLLNSI